jgi:hypothetical protein
MPFGYAMQVNAVWLHTWGYCGNLLHWSGEISNEQNHIATFSLSKEAGNTQHTITLATMHHENYSSWYIGSSTYKGLVYITFKKFIVLHIGDQDLSISREIWYHLLK